MMTIISLAWIALVVSVLALIIYIAPKVFNFVVGTIKWNLSKFIDDDYDDYE